MTPDVVALVLFYEKPEQTVDCLRALLPSGVAIHVLNNGSSSDATRHVTDFASRHPGITLWPSARNLGVAAGRNFLLERTRGEWIFFVDSDAVVRTGSWRDRLRDHIAAHPDVEAFVPRIFNVHESSYFDWRNVALDGDVVKERPRADETVNICPGTTLVRRSLFERLGFYDDGMFVGCEDFELALRALKMGAPIRGRCVGDIELAHDHRRALTAGDRTAVRARYDQETIARSFAHLLKKHNVRWTNDATGWSRMERGRMLGGPITRLVWQVRYRLRKAIEDYGVPFVARR